MSYFRKNDFSFIEINKEQFLTATNLLIYQI